MRKILVGAIGLLATGAWFIPLPAASADGSGSGFTMAVYGDSPYGNSVTHDTAQVALTPGFIDSVNADPDVSMVAHVGDIHSGKEFCTRDYDKTIRKLWRGFADPLVYTPGDNEWTDCHKPAQGGGTYNTGTQQIDFPNGHVDYQDGNPVANLALVRSIFFADPGKLLGGGEVTVMSQATAFDPAHPEDAQYVENVRFERDGVLFVTLNIPGGSNNDADHWYKTPAESAAQGQERQQRTAADLRWLDRAFSTATANGDQAVVIIEQADMWDLDGNPAAVGIPHLTNYDPFIQSIADHTSAFAKPVLLFEGDSHKYRSDNPLVNDAPCWFESGSCPDDAFDNQPGVDTTNLSVSNFHRVVVHGSTTPLEYLKLAFDPTADNATDSTHFGPFSWQRVQVGI